MPDNKLTPATQNSFSQIALIVLTTFAALVAFAANSVLCRLALGSSNIDPASFTAIRLLSGAITLVIIVLVSGSKRQKFLISFAQFKQVSAWWGPLMLTSYAVFFSFAYVQLNTATGALILFATVQFCLLAINRMKGNRLNGGEWLGLIMSFSGFALLVVPQIAKPSWVGLVLMIVAGIAWAFYTLAGKGSKTPIINTAQNFVLSIPFALIIYIAFIQTSQWNSIGLTLAIVSGSLASGVGYVLWYTALKHLSISIAAVSQLSVPLIAALGGVLWVNEIISNELIISAGLILTGIALVVIKIPRARKT